MIGTPRFMKTKLISFLAALLVSLAPQTWAEESFEPFEQEFKMSLSGFSANAVRSLTQLEDDSYEFRLSARNLMARYEEKSIFRLDESAQILPLEHSVTSKVFGVSRRQKTLFDWETKQATYTRRDTTRTVEIEAGLLDRALYQLLIPRDLAAGVTEPTYEFVDRGRIKTYTFGILDEEQVELTDDEVTAVKMKRVDDDEDKETLIWLAPEHNYELVKISHIDEDGSDYHMVLKGKLNDES